MSSSQNKANRTRNFRARVELERRVLSIINSRPKWPELIGLTEAAISDWISRCERIHCPDNAQQVAAILRAIALETGAISDQSREILSSAEIGHVKEGLISSLEKTLNEVPLGSDV